MKPALTLERLQTLLRYDPATGLFTRLIAPGKRSDLVGTVAGSINQGYILINVDSRRYKAHRLAFFYMTGEWPKALVDHRNRMKSDNRWVNLRGATKAQNEQSKGASVANTSGAKGVYWNKHARKWQAYIKTDGKARYLGLFASFDNAAAVRKAEEQRLFGEFAYQEGGTA